MAVTCSSVHACTRLATGSGLLEVSLLCFGGVHCAFPVDYPAELSGFVLFAELRSNCRCWSEVYVYVHFVAFDSLGRQQTAKLAFQTLLSHTYLLGLRKLDGVESLPHSAGTYWTECPT